MTRFEKFWKELKEWIVSFLIVMIATLVLLGVGYTVYQINSDYQSTKQKIEVVNDRAKEFLNQNESILKNHIELQANILENRKMTTNILSKTVKGFVNINNTFDFLETDIRKLLNENLKLKKEIVKINQKPSYKYLKSITTYIAGKGTTTDKEGKVQQFAWSGTGIIIKVRPFITYILTNAHIAGKGRKNVTLFVEDGLKQIKAEVVAYHASREIDLAVIKIIGTLEDKRPIKGISVAKPQDPVYLVGHHLGRKYIYGEGVFVGYDGINDIIQIPVLYGNSGSAVINKDGELVGVIHAIIGFRVGSPFIQKSKIRYFQIDNSHGLAVNGLNVKLFLQKLNLL